MIAIGDELRSIAAASLSIFRQICSLSRRSSASTKS